MPVAVYHSPSPTSLMEFEGTARRTIFGDSICQGYTPYLWASFPSRECSTATKVGLIQRLESAEIREHHHLGIMRMSVDSNGQNCQEHYINSFDVGPAKEY